MPKILFKTHDQEEAHKELEKALGQTRKQNQGGGFSLEYGKPKHPDAYIREFSDDPEGNYQIWDGVPE